MVKQTDQDEKISFALFAFSLISIHIFRLSLTLFFVREKYLGRKINVHFLRVSAKNCCKRKLGFAGEKISQKLKYLNFKCEQSGRSFFVLFCSFHHSAHVPCEKFSWRQAKRVSGNQAFEVQIFQLLRNFLTAKPIRLLS